MWPDWFTEKITLASGGCWLWTGALTSDRYAQAKVNGRFTRVHRWAWVQVCGQPAGRIVLHHECGRRHCVNPDHLEAMSQSEHWRLHRIEEEQLRALRRMREAEILADPERSGLVGARGDQREHAEAGRPERHTQDPKRIASEGSSSRARGL